MTTTRLLATTTPLRAGKVGGWYDLLVTVGFLTPWTAALIFDLLRAVHTTLGLPGDVLPAFDGPHMMFVNLFGAGVTMWAVARVLSPVPWMVGIDTLGRLTFSIVFVSILMQGHSAVLVPFLVLELAFLVWQGWSVLAALRAERLGRGSGESRPARVAAAAGAGVGR